MQFNLHYHRLRDDSTLGDVLDPKSTEIADNLIYNATSDEMRARLFMGQAWNDDGKLWYKGDYRIGEYSRDKEGRWTFTLRSTYASWFVVVTGYSEDGPW